MYLKRLEIQGFKSFAQATVLTFEPGITSVVGPNGSGKSNVADAVRWVLGEQSKTILRGKKAEDVIFVGSDSKARATSATVSVIFDNRDGKLPIDSAEVVFTRRLHRDGTSEYLINNEPSRLLDITESLAKAGFAQSRYTVIGQGVIDQFLLQGPAEIKGLIEEACGIAPFYAKREKTVRRLETTRDNLAQVAALIAEIEPRLRTLRRQAKRLEQKAELEKEWRRLASGRYAYILSSLQSEKGSLESRIAELGITIDEAAREVQGFYQSIESRDDESTRRSELLSSLQTELSHEQAYKEKLQVSLAEVRMNMQAAARPSEGPDKSLLAIRVSELEQKLSDISAQLNESNTNLEATRADIDEIISILESAKPELVVRFKPIAQKFIVTQEQFVERLMAEKRDTGLALDKIKAELAASVSLPVTNDYAEREQTINAELKEKQAKIDELRARIEAELANMTSYTSGRQEADKHIRSLESQLQTLRNDQNTLKVSQARVETRLEEEVRKVSEDFGSEYQAVLAQAEAIADENIDRDVLNLKRQLEAIGGLDDMTLQEYQETEERFTYLTTQTQDLEKAAVDLEQVLGELNEVIKKRFNEAYNLISTKFSDYFRMLFNGGKAELNLLKEKRNVEGDDGQALEGEAEELQPTPDAPHKGDIIGVEVRATPPGKKLSSIAALSGGERSLTSIALLMAMLDAYPSPFVVLDEADAALDESNSIRFATILGQLADRTQFITITHNRETMRRAHTLYGVTMSQGGVSRILSIKLDQSLEYAKD